MNHATLLCKLKSLCDEQYKSFHSKLMPTVENEHILGIRTPTLRSFAKSFSKESYSTEFIASLPHYYYEEDNLHALLICQNTDFAKTVSLLNDFLPYVNNWATCDLMKPKSFIKNTDKLISIIKSWLNSDHTYTVRFGLNMLLKFYLDEKFCEEYLTLASKVDCTDYYLSTMVAWFFATALAKQYSATLPYIENNLLDKQTHNRTIQKAVESYRINPNQKQYLKTLKRK